MNIYETSAIVEDQGQVRVAGVPFAPGTEVEITPAAEADAKARGQIRGPVRDPHAGGG